MEKQMVRKFKWFWGWNDDREEAWLHEMALQGLHLQNIAPFGFYEFETGEPRNDTYRLDFTSARGRERNHYLQLFMDAGWEYVGQMSSWQYFRKAAAPGEEPEIFSDNESKVKKYQHLLAVLVVFLPIFAINLSNLSKHAGLFSQILTAVFFVYILFFSFAILMILRRISKLKKKL